MVRVRVDAPGTRQQLYHRFHQMQTMTVGLSCPHVNQRVMRLNAILRNFLPILAVALVFALSHANWLLAQQEAQPLNCELRIVWGGDTPRSYGGSITSSDGSLKVVRLLSLQEDAINSIQNNEPQSLVIQPRSPSSFGGIDVAVRGTSSTQLTLKFEDPYAQEPKEFEVSLTDLLHGTWVKMLDERGNRVAIERQLHDIIRVTSDLPTPIFDGGQVWPISVEGKYAGLPAGQYTAELRFVRDGHVVGEARRESLSLDSTGSFAPLHVDLQAPNAAGAYLLEIELQHRNYLKSLVSTGPMLLRRVELVVFDRLAKAKRVDSWKMVASIDPLRASKPGSLAWLTSFDILSPLGIPNGRNIADKLQPYNPLSGSLNQPISHGSLGSRQIKTTEVSAESACLTLEPSAWLAIPLQGLQPDQMHRIRVRAPMDQCMELGISLAQLNGRGEFTPLTLDSGIVVTARQTSDNGGLPEHAISFWPRVEKTYIILANTSRDRIASVWDIRIDRAESSVATKHDIDATAAAANDQPTRMIGLHLAKPLLADSVCAQRDRDPVIDRELESWHTWQQSIDRICQHMHARSVNTLMVTGFSDGGAVFPSERLGATRRYDSGTFFSDGRCIEIKDAIELMLRHFDREGFRLVLGLDLGSSLPSLRRFENVAGQESLMQQSISDVQDSPLENRTRYNPLNARVQEEILAIFREIVGRYKHHRSFAGISIQLDGRSHLTFAGDRWGYDAQTLQAFEQATQLKLPPREQLETIFSGPARLTFLSWRAAELTKFYQRLGEVVWSADDRRKLYLNAARLWDEFPTESHFFSPDSIVRSPHEYLLANGIDTERLATSVQIELMRGSVAAESDSVNARDWILRESRERGLIETNSEPNSSAVVLQNPSRHELESFSKLTGSGRRWIYPTYSQPRELARKRLVNQVYQADPLLLVEGGWLPFSGEDDARNSLVRVLSDFPPVKLEQVALREKETNLSVRLGVYDGKTYLQLVNNASWAENLSIGFQFAAASDATAGAPQARVLGDRQLDLASDESTHAGPNRWVFSLQPYEIIGIEIADASFSLTSLQHAPVEGTKETIANELNQLENLITRSADVAQRALLGNLDGEFERWSEDGTPIGWSVSTLPQVTIGQSYELPHTGKSSLLIENRNQNPVSAWAQSRTMTPPQTGRVAVQAWLRVPAVSQPVTVKLAVVCRTRLGDRIERSVVLGGKSSDNNDSDSALPIDWGRKPALLYVGDISDGDVSELSVSIELIGPGKVWVDDVQIFESILQPDERNHLRGQLLGVKQQLEANNLFPAEQLLDSNWGKYLLRIRSLENRELRTASIPIAAPTAPLPGSGKRENWSDSPSSFRQFRETLRDRWRR